MTLMFPFGSSLGVTGRQLRAYYKRKELWYLSVSFVISCNKLRNTYVRNDRRMVTEMCQKAAQFQFFIQHHEDADTLNADTLNADTLNADTLNADTLKADTLNESPITAS